MKPPRSSKNPVLYTDTHTRESEQFLVSPKGPILKPNKKPSSPLPYTMLSKELCLRPQQRPRGEGAVGGHSSNADTVPVLLRSTYIRVIVIQCSRLQSKPNVLPGQRRSPNPPAPQGRRGHTLSPPRRRSFLTF